MFKKSGDGDNKEGDKFGGNAETPLLILARRLGGLTLGVSGLGLAMGASPSGPLRYGREA